MHLIITSLYHTKQNSNQISLRRKKVLENCTYNVHISNAAYALFKIEFKLHQLKIINLQAKLNISIDIDENLLIVLSCNMHMQLEHQLAVNRPSSFSIILWII